MDLLKRKRKYDHKGKGRSCQIQYMVNVNLSEPLQRQPEFRKIIIEQYEAVDMQELRKVYVEELERKQSMKRSGWQKERMRQIEKKVLKKRIWFEEVEEEAEIDESLDLSEIAQMIRKINEFQ